MYKEDEIDAYNTIITCVDRLYPSRVGRYNIGEYLVVMLQLLQYICAHV